MSFALFPFLLSRAPRAFARLAPLALITALMLAACGGGGSEDVLAGGEGTNPLPPQPPTPPQPPNPTSEQSPALVSAPAQTVAQGSAITEVIFVNSGGAVQPNACKISPALPAGLSLDVSASAPASCRISGVPTVAVAQTTYTVTASNGAGPSTALFTLTVLAAEDVLVPPQSPPVLTDTTVLDSSNAIVVSASGQALAAGSCAFTSEGRSAATLDGLRIANTANGCQITGTPTTVTTTTTRAYTVTATGSSGASFSASLSLVIKPTIGASDADADGNGLIEISSLEMLNHIRFNLAGTSYKTSAGDSGNSSGCPESGCFGYELTQNLNFDTDGDGTWSGNAVDGYILDADDNNATYFPISSSAATSAGWTPVGDDSTGDEASHFTATFDGNGYVIANLIVHYDLENAGFFGVLNGSAVVRNLGLVGALVNNTGVRRGSLPQSGILAGNQKSGSIASCHATGHINGFDDVGGLVGRSSGAITASYAAADVNGVADLNYLGGLVGWQVSGGTITASYATGSVNGGGGMDDIGGLVGQQISGVITASYATGSVSGGADPDDIGGLVGQQFSGAITASYATGSVSGGGGMDDIGGLVGQQLSGAITASFATGSVSAGMGENDMAGGLVGSQGNRGAITASYATGDVDGGAGNNDGAGGLVGNQGDFGAITASYATGDVDGGTGSLDDVGALVGRRSRFADPTTTVASYGFGAVDGEMDNSAATGNSPPSGVVSAAGLTATNAGDEWNQIRSNTQGAWDFGTAAQTPALRYADYDAAAGSSFSCSAFSTGLCDTLIAPAEQGRN